MGGEGGAAQRWFRRGLRRLNLTPETARGSMGGAGGGQGRGPGFPCAWRHGIAVGHGTLSAGSTPPDLACVRGPRIAPSPPASHSPASPSLLRLPCCC